MAERRTLIEGLEQTPEVDPDVERAIVFQKKPPRNGEGTTQTVAVTTAPPSTATARAPISTRIRADYAAALKRASLERQLAKVEPNTISDILETALEPWLKANGYLS